MDTLSEWLSLLEGQDFFSSLLLIGVLLYAGQHMVRKDPASRHLGQLAAGLMLGLVVFDALMNGLSFSDIAGQAVLLPSLVLGAAWIAFPVVRSLYAGTLGGLLKMLGAGWKGHTERREESRRRAEQERLRLRDEEERQRAAPERERRQREEEQKRQQERQDQQRRNDARFRCLLLYDQHAHELAGSIPREAVEAHIERFMTDAESPQCVEQRAEQLCTTFRQRLETSGGERPSFKTLQELSEHYRRQRESVAASGFDEELRDYVLASLARAEQEAVLEFCRS